MNAYMMARRSDASVAAADRSRSINKPRFRGEGNGLLTGADPAELLDKQAAMLASEPIAHGQDWASRNSMYYDRVARMGFSGFTFEECAELHMLRTRELHGKALCMLPATRARYDFMVEASRLYPIH